MQSEAAACSTPTCDVAAAGEQALQSDTIQHMSYPSKTHCGLLTTLIKHHVALTCTFALCLSLESYPHQSRRHSAVADIREAQANIEKLRQVLTVVSAGVQEGKVQQEQQNQIALTRKSKRKPYSPWLSQPFLKVGIPHCVFDILQSKISSRERHCMCKSILFPKGSQVM